MAGDQCGLAVVTGGGRGIGRGIVAVAGGAGIRAGGQLPLGSRGGGIRVPRSRGAGLAACRGGLCRCRGPGRRPPAAGDGDRNVTAGSTSGSITPGIAPDERLDLLETTPESWDRVLNTNLKGPFFLTQAVANAMIGSVASRNGRAAPDRLHQFDLEHFRQREPGGILRGQGGLEHGGPALRGPACGAGDSRLRDQAGADRDGDDPARARSLLRQDRGGTDADSPLGNTRGRRPRRRRDRGGAFPYSTGATLYVDGGLHPAGALT